MKIKNFTGKYVWIVRRRTIEKVLCIEHIPGNDSITIEYDEGVHGKYDCDIHITRVFEDALGAYLFLKSQAYQILGYCEVFKNSNGL